MAKHKFMQPESVDELLASLGGPDEPVLKDPEFKKLVATAREKIKSQKTLKKFLSAALVVAKMGAKVFL